MNCLNFYKNKTVLVTGGAGAIGRNLSEKLSKSGAKKVIILDNLCSSYEWNIPDLPNILFVKGDIRDNNDLFRVFRHRPQIVFHLAAFFANQKSIEYPVVNDEVNSLGLINVLELSIISGSVEKFIYINSEGGAYGINSRLPYSEENLTLVTSSPYYISKMAGEAYCLYYYRQHDLPVIIVRLFNCYGPGEVPGNYRNVIPNFIFWALNNKPLPLTGGKGIARDFIYVDDAVDGIIRAGFYKKAIGEAINIGTGRKTFIYDLAEIINRKTKNNAGVKILSGRKWDTRPVITGNVSKANVLIDFAPSVNLNHGIDLTIQWFKKTWVHICKSAEFPPGINPALGI